MSGISLYLFKSAVFISMMIFDFTTSSDISSWRVVDDMVMGGRSNGNFIVSKNGNGFFYGKVSLENNGGFSSVRHRFDNNEVTRYSSIVIRLRGDGKKYQFRVKSDIYDRFSYVAHFETNKKWQSIRIPFSSMYPSFRGARLNYPNYPGKTMGELAFLISNKKEEDFWLEIDKISLE